MKLSNKQKKAFKIGKELIIVDLVKPPVFYCQGIELTEYDVRSIQRQVALGDLCHTKANQLKITDERGIIFEFREDGVLKNTPYGYQIMANMSLDIMKIQRLKQKSNH